MNNFMLHFISSFVPTKRLRRKVREKLTLPCFCNKCLISGQNNKVVLVDKYKKEINLKKVIPGLNIKLFGKNNKIIFHENIEFKGNIDVDSENAIIEIGKNVRGNLNIRAMYGYAQKLVIGDNTIMHDVRIVLDEIASVKIGSNVLMSTQVLLQASDGHSVIDIKNKKPINSIKHSLEIGDHVWIGFRTILLKNTHIYKDSVLGAGSVACKDYKEPNVVIAGNPAVIIKKDITWDKMSPFILERTKGLK